MKRAFIMLYALVLFVTLSSAAHATTYSEPALGATLEIPKGWQIKSMPGLKYKIIHGTPADGFAPNINFVDEEFNGSVDEYAKANLKAIQSAFQNFKKLDMAPFTTNSGLRA